MNIVLSEGEEICPKCNGKGTVDNYWVCNKCNGDGKVDWISKAVQRPKKRTALDKINVVRVINHIKKVINDNMFESDIERIIKPTLDHLKKNRAIFDYKVNVYPNGNLTVHISPDLSLDSINMHIKIED
jgi:RecJ-like exonuclease